MRHDTRMPPQSWVTLALTLQDPLLEVGWVDAWLVGLWGGWGVGVGGSYKYFHAMIMTTRLLVTSRMYFWGAKLGRCFQAR